MPPTGLRPQERRANTFEKKQHVRKQIIVTTTNQGKFKKGSTGHPAERPNGSRNQATLECDQLLQAAASDLIRVLIEEAQKGNMQAMTSSRPSR